MIRIELNVSYPGLTPSEEGRLQELIRRSLQHHIVSVACSMVKDAIGPDDDGDFLNSYKLDIDGTIKVV